MVSPPGDPGPRPHDLRAGWVALGLASLALHGWIAVLSRDFNYGRDWGIRPIVPWLALHTCLGILWLTAVWLAFRRRTDRRTWWLIAAFAVAFRACYFDSNSIQEDDFYRYLWDGRVLLAGVNPYAYAPDEVEAAARPEAALVQAPAERAVVARLAALRRESPRAEEVFGRINHPFLPTIYPPVSEGVFALAAALRPWSLNALRVVVAGFDLGTILVLGLLLRALGRDPAGCVVYAWSPLVVKEFANSAHVDAAMLFLLALGALAWVRGRRLLALAPFALAVLGKLSPIVLAPVLLGWFWAREGRRRFALALALYVAIVAGAWMPFLLGGRPIFRALEYFGRRFQMNAGAFALLRAGSDRVVERWGGTARAAAAAAAAGCDVRWPRLAEAARRTAAIDDVGAARLLTRVAAAGLLGCLLLGLLRGLGRIDPGMPFLHRLFVALAGAFLLGPTAFPWYLTWVFPFLCLFPYRSLLLLAVTIMVYYLDFYFDYHGLPDLFDGMPPLEWVPVWGWLGWEAVRVLRRGLPGEAA